MATNKRDELPLHLPLAEYVAWACEQNNRQYRPPGRHDKFRTPLFEFVRLCKAHPELRGLNSDDALGKLNGFDWVRAFRLSEDPLIEFLTTWDKVRVAAGDDILANAIGLARQKPLKLRRPHSEDMSCS